MLAAFLMSSLAGFSQNEQKDYRPQYHYTPPKNWVNDPNGLIYLEGEYHLFYQYNPFGNKWGHMSWGHAVSKDLKNWETLPVALPEFDNADGSQTMIFSGCAVIDSENTSGFFGKGVKNGMVAIFTSHVDKKGQGLAQHQSIAYSTDKGRTWKHYEKNPVLDLGMKDFRDPNVIWYPERQVWIMTVVKPLEHIAQFYESKDLKKWTLLSEFGKQGDMTKIWECPSLTKIQVEGTNESKWVLMISSGHREKNYLGMQYFVGDFDGKTFTPDPSVQKNKPVWIDYGRDDYAGVTWSDIPARDGRRLFLGWMSNWDYATLVPTVRATRGNFSGPMTISATAPISAIFEMPRSITGVGTATNGSGLGFGFDVDGGLFGVGRVAHLPGRRGGFLFGGRSVLHSVLETLDGAAQIRTHVLELLGAEHHHHDQQNDQPVPNGK